MSPVVRNDTHEVRIDRARGLVVKRFRSTGRDEPVRALALTPSASACGQADTPHATCIKDAPAHLRMTQATNAVPKQPY